MKLRKLTEGSKTAQNYYSLCFLYFFQSCIPACIRVSAVPLSDAGEEYDFKVFRNLRCFNMSSVTHINRLGCN